MEDQDYREWNEEVLYASSCDPRLIPPWTDNDKQRLNKVLAKAFGWKGQMSEEQSVKLIADKELVDKVAKNIVKGRMVHPVMQPMFDTDKEEFKRTFNEAIDEVWSGSEEGDEEQRNQYRKDAMCALRALGYEVQIEDVLLSAAME